MLLSSLDFLALAWFLAAWLGYSLLLDRSAAGKTSLTALMAIERRRWMEVMALRENRIVDAALIGGLQQGTAFFASTSLLAVGGALSLLRVDEAVLTTLARALPFAVETSRVMWEVKVLGLAVILVYAFFKFAWSYRIFNYAAILVGATAPPTEDQAAVLAQAEKAAAMQTVAAGDFNRGMRALFFALGYLGWLVGPLVLIVSTSAVLIVLYRRQFASPAVMAVTGPRQREGAPASE